MIIFILKSAMTLALLYCCGFALLSRETFHRFNRAVLLGILVASLVVPVVRVRVEHPLLETLGKRELAGVNRSYQETLARRPNGSQLTDDTFAEENAGLIGQEIRPLTTANSSYLRLTPTEILYTLYIIGVAVMLLLFALRLAMLVRHLRGGLRHTDERGNTVILRQGDVAPFSVFRFIVMSVDDYEAHGREILAHEQEHIRLGHTFDLLLAEAVKALQWFNPFAWLLTRDLEAVHEYEADEAVINKGIDAIKYQQLLVLKVVGNRLQPFANSLSRSTLKQRIIMMHKKKSSGGMMLKALLAIPAIAFALYAFASPREETKELTEKKELTGVNGSYRKLTDVAPSTDVPVAVNDSAQHVGEKVYEQTEVLPHYKGGEMALLKLMQDNLKYPKSAELAKKQGTVMVQFVVYTDGTIGNVNAVKSIDKDLDTEAIRVIKLTNGKWEPARDKGKAVNCKFSMPVTYRLK